MQQTWMGTVTPMSFLALGSEKKIVWYENDGNQSFTAHTVVSGLQVPSSVFAADVDSDGDLDVLSATALGAVLWHENDGRQNFTHHILPTTSTGGRQLYGGRGR